MRIKNLTENSQIYTSNVFLVLGEWNTTEDLTTLIDVGFDNSIINKIKSMNMGLGKKKIDQVVLTHSHSDHAAILPAIKEAFNPVVYAFNSYLKGIDKILLDESVIRIGEQYFEVFHITAHSYDSICLYCEEVGVLFAGDTNFPLDFENPQLKEENAYPLSRLAGKRVKTLYNGHGSEQDYTNKPFQLVKEENKLFNT
jgi:glyoxylase-like metal-dependent hydrolase (beta-lactamase superfamily II)